MPNKSWISRSCQLAAGMASVSEFNSGWSPGSGTRTSTTYTPVVEYTYTVNGATLQGKRLSPGGTMSYDYNTAQGILSRYQPGQPVTVHYDPANPTQAVLETKAAGSLLLFILGGVFLAIGLGIGGVSTVMSLLALF